MTYHCENPNNVEEKHRENTRDNAIKEISDLINVLINVDCRLTSCRVFHDRRAFWEKLPIANDVDCRDKLFAQMKKGTKLSSKLSLPWQNVCIYD